MRRRDTGWTAGETATLDTPFEAGAATLVLVQLEGLMGRDAQRCDLLGQDCAAGEKCRVVFFNDAAGTQRAGTDCAPDGSVPEGDSCVRASGAGDDDCAAGGYCAYWGLPQSTPQERTCHAFCTEDGECDAGEICLGVGAIEVSGNCAATCEPFGDDCVAGTHCSPIASVHDGERSIELICNFIGTGGEGSPCTFSTDCVADMACIFLAADGASQCRPMCDAMHPCTFDSECRVTDDTPMPGLGFCPPAS